MVVEGLREDELRVYNLDGSPSSTWLTAYQIGEPIWTPTGDSVIMPMRTLVDMPDPAPQSGCADFFKMWSSEMPDYDIDMITRTTGHHLSPVAYNESRDPIVEGGAMQTRVIIDATKPFHLPFSTTIEPNWDLWESMKVEDYIAEM